MPRAQASLVSYIPWFDRPGAGMAGDNIHGLNRGSVIAQLTVGLPGATPDSFAVGPGSATYVSFPAGTIGGPVTVTSDQPVLAAQRVQYYQSFNEEVARPASEAQPLRYFNWFDRETAGMAGDNIHILNAGTAVANVTVSLPGAANIGPFALQAGQETYVTFGPGHIGGPVTVSSDPPVLASQRVQYYQSFNDGPAATPAQAK